MSHTKYLFLKKRARAPKYKFRTVHLGDGLYADITPSGTVRLRAGDGITREKNTIVISKRQILDLCCQAHANIDHQIFNLEASKGATNEPNA